MSGSGTGDFDPDRGKATIAIVETLLQGDPSLLVKLDQAVWLVEYN
jgi:hypothetical protein